jgi:hypothetical protein
LSAARAACARRARRSGSVEPKHAERQRDAAAGPPRADLDQLEAAAAEVADDPVGVGDADSTPSPASRAFFLGAQHLAVEADAVDLVDEFGAVAASRIAAVATTGPASPHMVDQQRKRLSAASARSCRLIGGKRARSRRPAPRPASTFSLKIGVGTRGAPA